MSGFRERLMEAHALIYKKSHWTHCDNDEETKWSQCFAFENTECITAILKDCFSSDHLVKLKQRSRNICCREPILTTVTKQMGTITFIHLVLELRENNWACSETEEDHLKSFLKSFEGMCHYNTVKLFFTWFKRQQQQLLYNSGVKLMLEKKTPSETLSNHHERAVLLYST